MGSADAPDKMPYRITILLALLSLCQCQTSTSSHKPSTTKSVLHFTTNTTLGDIPLTNVSLSSANNTSKNPPATDVFSEDSQKKNPATSGTSKSSTSIDMTVTFSTDPASSIAKSSDFISSAGTENVQLNQRESVQPNSQSEATQTQFQTYMQNTLKITSTPVQDTVNKLATSDEGMKNASESLDKVIIDNSTLKTSSQQAHKQDTAHTIPSMSQWTSSPATLSTVSASTHFRVISQSTETGLAHGTPKSTQPAAQSDLDVTEGQRHKNNIRLTTPKLKQATDPSINSTRYINQTKTSLASTELEQTSTIPHYVSVNTKARVTSLDNINLKSTSHDGALQTKRNYIHTVENAAEETTHNEERSATSQETTKNSTAAPDSKNDVLEDTQQKTEHAPSTTSAYDTIPGGYTSRTSGMSTHYTTEKSNTDSIDIGKQKSSSVTAGIIGVCVTAILTAVICCALILLKWRRCKHKQQDNITWAGHSPFLDGIGESKTDKTGQSQESTRVTLISILPQPLSMLAAADKELVMEEVPMMGLTFGKDETEKPACGNHTDCATAEVLEGDGHSPQSTNQTNGQVTTTGNTFGKSDVL